LTSSIFFFSTSCEWGTASNEIRNACCHHDEHNANKRTYAGFMFLWKTALKTVSFSLGRRQYFKIRIIEFRGHGGCLTGGLEDVVHGMNSMRSNKIQDICRGVSLRSLSFVLGAGGVRAARSPLTNSDYQSRRIQYVYIYIYTYILYVDFRFHVVV
jgi:hypothetical protein